MTEQELLKDCLVRLDQSGINYMLVGSMAGNYWGIPRSTHDIDFVIEYEAKDVSRIVELFDGDFFIQQASVQMALNPPYQFNALDNRSALKVDFFRLAGDDVGSVPPFKVSQRAVGLIARTFVSEKVRIT